MADVKKIATRESYGNALKELAEEFPNLVVLDADLAAATKTGIFKKHIPTDILTAVLQSATWWVLRQVWQPWARFPL